MSQKNSPTIAGKIAQLDELLEWFESDDFELESALDKFTEAEKLAKEIEAELADFKNKITVIKNDFSKPA